MTRRYEVTIPFKPGPWYSVEVEADDKASAIVKAVDHARLFGFTGKRGRATAVELK